MSLVYVDLFDESPVVNRPAVKKPVREVNLAIIAQSQLYDRADPKIDQLLSLPLQMTMARTILMNQIESFVAMMLMNGILQHSPEWDIAKMLTVGGSQIATIMGLNPFSTVFKMIAEKIGMSKFMSDIKTQWGNLFESLIKLYVEWDKHTRVVGSDIFIPGPPNTSYSPDGLGVVNIIREWRVERADGRGHDLILSPRNCRALFEFKCPQTRIPSGEPPKYYVPQVKYGLDLLSDKIKLDIGLFIEAVFRRCSWADLGDNAALDLELTKSFKGGVRPLAYGFIGFYFDTIAFNDLLVKCKDNPRKHTPADVMICKNTLNKYYRLAFEIGDASNDFMSNDLGDMNVDLFKTVMRAFDFGILHPWYAPMQITGRRNFTDQHSLYDMHMQRGEFEAFCAEAGHLNFGVLPWKLFRIDYHYIDPEPGFVNQWKPKIDEVINVVRECMVDESKKMQVYQRYVGNNISGGFDE